MYTELVFWRHLTQKITIHVDTNNIIFICVINYYILI